MSSLSSLVWSGVVVLSLVTCLKVLLVPGYVSTDYDVHRAWLALTHATPVAEWYTDTLSMWTLDYPPLFAWVEAGLASVVAHLHPGLVARLGDDAAVALRTEDPSSVAVHRGTVMALDLVLLAGAVYAVMGLWSSSPPKSPVLPLPRPPSTNSLPSIGMDSLLSAPKKRAPGSEHFAPGLKDPATVGWRSPQVVSLVLILASPALLLLDHVHFQYNGFLTGVLLLSIGGVTSREGYFFTAVMFALLLGLKHLYLVLGPVYLAFLFRAAVVEPNYDGARPTWRLSKTRFAVLALIVVTILGATFGPFVAWGLGPDVLARLFPFQRGLVHAYWAPNVWALYAAAEVALTSGSSSGLTSGLVGEYTFSALPDVTPLHTLILTLLFVLISMGKVYLTTPAGALTAPPHGDAARVLRYLQRPAVVFIHALVESSLVAFMFGWHVHEKALLVPLIPLALLAPTTPRYAGMFAFLQAVAHTALFPLFPAGPTTMIKLGLSAAYALYVWMMLKPAMPRLYKAYLVALVGVVVFTEVLAPILVPSLPFLPTMVTSVYGAVGVTMAFGWILLY